MEPTSSNANAHNTQHNKRQDLEYPYQRPRVFHHQGKAPVECLRWNPHVSHQDFVASVSSAQASVLVWRVDNDYRPLMAGLRKHTRCVRIIAWCVPKSHPPHNPPPTHTHTSP